MPYRTAPAKKLTRPPYCDPDQERWNQFLARTHRRRPRDPLTSLYLAYALLLALAFLAAVMQG